MATHNPTTSKKLDDQAAAAALYVTEPQRQVRDVRKEANYPLDANGKLTSAGAAASLRRADAKDLPSFPSVGIAQAAAGGAAGLAVQNTKSPEWWKPEASAGASKAAMAAKDYKMKPLWEPEASAAGSKAALLAHQKGHGLNLWEPSASDKALIAAAGAASGQKGVQHGKSQTTETGLADRYPDEKNAAKNALSAATLVHNSTTRSKYNDLPGLSDEEAEKVRRQAMVKGMVGEMFGSNPLIGPELQERQHQESLHAAAVTMAQGMYGKRDQAYREKMSAARAGSRAATSSRGLEDDSDDEETPMSFMGLQAAAQKLANERLAKLNDPDAAYREHYGTNTPPPKNRLSMFGGGSLRRKDSDEDMTDEKRSRKIRGEMNLFQDKLKEIDARKRKDDRSALLAAAQRNVKALSAEMDEDVFQRTGKMSPAMKADWEAQARARAQAESEERNANFGKVKIGGGKYMDQTEIDAIARERLQPTLDAVSAKAAHDREVDEQNKIAEEERKRIERENKEQEKYQNMKIKEEWKKFKAEENAEKKAHDQEAKVHHDEEKEAERDAKMQEKFEHQKEKEHEHEVKAFEKEQEKQQKEEWKAFKEQEKEEEKARKEENRMSKGSRFGSIFRRKSKKEKTTEKEEKPAATVIPAGSGATTTTITAGEPVTEARESIHHEEPRHSQFAALEETPEAKAANQQKPGGSLLSLFKSKKEEHDEKKRHSTAEAATAGAATGALAGAAATNGSALVGKDEPGKAQASTGVPAAEAVAPEHEHDKTQDIAEPAIVSEPVVSAAPVAETSAPETVTSSTHPTTAATVSEPSGLLYDPQIVAPRVAADDGEEIGATNATVVPATTTGATLNDSTVDRAEKPAVHDAGHQGAAVAEVASPDERFGDATEAPVTAPVVAPAPEPVVAPVEQPPAIQHDTSATDAPLPTETEPASRSFALAPAPVFPDSTAESTTPAPATAPVGPQSAGPAALGSDKPVTSEINHSKIVDTLDPRANVGKPGFTGSEKFAAATADMRGTDHAGAKAPATETSTPTSSSAVPVSTGASSQAKGKGAEATHEGGKVDAPLAERIAVPAEALAAAEGANEKGGKHGNVRQTEPKKQNRLSGFFKNKLGMKVKEHKGSDGVTVTPTTQYTTMGKYVDPNDKHTTNSTAPIPANAPALEGTGGPSSDAAHKTAATSSTEGHASSSTTAATNPILHMEPAAGTDIGATKTEPYNPPANPSLESDASAIAVDPAFREETADTRGRVSGVRSEESDEARDTVAEQLQPPKAPGLPRASESPARETRFKEELFG